ncbi:MAG: molybdopterin oxidoreductase [Alphaproteobacteria bacterium]|nr:molybdopterin oxidoreductase [Alphaproteobacteria bacterium]
MARAAVFAELRAGRPGAVGIGLALGAVVLLGLIAAHAMETEGHVITGMTNRVVWGMPHVFAIFLIVAASGALNVASMASVFGREAYKPLSRLSGVLALALLLGGLAVLVLDLGRPDRLIVAMTHFNFRSIFAWNIFLYTGFVAVVGAYLVIMMSPRWAARVKTAGTVAFLWRLILTTGTGSIFGFLLARPAYDSAILAPLFIALSLVFGQAAFLLVLLGLARFDGRPVGDQLVTRLARLLGLLAAVALYFTALQHLTALYAPARAESARFVLVEGGIYTLLFWGHVLIGGVAPMVLAWHPAYAGRRGPAILAAALALIGGMVQIYVIVIGGQVQPLPLFPGLIVEGGVLDGGVAPYAPSLPEFGLGLGGVALALLGVALAARFLPLLPLRLADD